MSDFESYACANCGDDFRAHPSANAAANEYCSPVCESSGKDL